MALGFGHRSSWIAVRDAQPADLGRVLGLTDLSKVRLSTGVAAVREPSADASAYALFIIPPVCGWTLVVLDVRLPEDEQMGGGVIDLAALSRLYGEVQKFSTHRVPEYHEWQRWSLGSPIRCFRWVGETGEVQWNEGTPAKVEKRLRASETADAREVIVDEVDEQLVLDVAGEWSVDPTSVEEAFESEGLLGYLEKE
jgi:hypothetical protein